MKKANLNFLIPIAIFVTCYFACPSKDFSKKEEVATEEIEDGLEDELFEDLEGDTISQIEIDTIL